jgi:hypothetical protein
MNNRPVKLPILAQLINLFKIFLGSSQKKRPKGSAEGKVPSIALQRTGGGILVVTIFFPVKDHS